MSAGHTQLPSAIAFQFAARLEAYDQDVECMTACPSAPDVYHRVARHMDEMRLYAASLPELSVAWVELLIRHFELMHGLWQQQQGEVQREAARELRQQHRGALQRLSRQCLRLIPGA